ncbi:MAG: hypothetical protein O8C56_01530 [Candidatus Methanoperedens sp.]|nr:hypothetical protein [Candidatus Methanoperedens sp.]
MIKLSIYRGIMGIDGTAKSQIAFIKARCGMRSQYLDTLGIFSIQK